MTDNWVAVDYLCKQCGSRVPTGQVCPNCDQELLIDCCVICGKLKDKDGICHFCYPNGIRSDAQESDGLKADEGKLRLDLLPIEALEELSKVYAFGEKKYSAHNWRKGMQWSRLFAACMRHMFAWYRGETHDQESGLNHLIHAAFCIMCLITFEKTHPEKDDRPTIKQ